MNHKLKMKEEVKNLSKDIPEEKEEVPPEYILSDSNEGEEPPSPEEIPGKVEQYVSVWVEILNMPGGWGEKEIMDYFTPFFSVLKAKVEKQPDSTCNQGNAMVLFQSFSEAEQAIELLSNKYNLPGASIPVFMRIVDEEYERLGIKARNPLQNLVLSVSAVTEKNTEKELRSLFENFGIVKAVEIFVEKKKAKITYSKTESALLAFQNIHNKIKLEDSGNFLALKFKGNGSIPEQIEPMKHEEKVKIIISNPNATSPQYPQSSVQETIVAPRYSPPFRPNLDIPPPPFSRTPYVPASNYFPNQVPVRPQSLSPFPTPLVIYKQYFSQDGRPYYYNTITKTTQWNYPYGNSRIIPGTPKVQPRLNPDRNGFRIQGAPGNNLFIFFLPVEWDDEELRSRFAPFGNVISSRVMIDKETGRSKGFGFISYDNHDSAQNAIKAMNGLLFSGKRLKVEFKKGDELVVPPKHSFFK